MRNWMVVVALEGLALVSLGGCGAAQRLGASFNQVVDVDIDNKGKEAVCSLVAVNRQNVVQGGDTRVEPVDVKPKERKTVHASLPLDQERVLQLKSCSGKILKEEKHTVASASDRVHLVVD
jgi:hypothetical protein